jgi:chemotaxis protein CheD
MELFQELAGRERFLKPGEVAYGDDGMVLGTLLGSCVAITLWHAQRRAGALCHFVLASGSSAAGPNGHYGDGAFTLMLDALVRHRIDPRSCVAKVFGGGKMFGTAHLPDIGARNVAQAYALLEAAGLTPQAENIGQAGYRRLFFDTGSGDVWIKFEGIPP